MHDLDELTDDALSAQLDHLERAVARATAARHARQSRPGRLVVDDELLGLVEREHSLVQELRRRHRRVPALDAA